MKKLFCIAGLLFSLNAFAEETLHILHIEAEFVSIVPDGEVSKYKLSDISVDSPMTVKADGVNKKGELCHFAIDFFAVGKGELFGDVQSSTCEKGKPVKSDLGTTARVLIDSINEDDDTITINDSIDLFFYR